MNCRAFPIRRWGREAALAVLVACTMGTLFAQTDFRWTDSRVIGPLVCHAEFPLQEHADVFVRLGELQGELCRRLEIAPASEPIELYLFESKGSYREFVGRFYPELQSRRAGYIKGDGPGVVVAYLSPSFEIDLRHECTHALLHAVLPLVPLWLDEGLAEYFENAPDRRLETPHRAAVLWQSRLGMTLPLERLETLADFSAMGRNEYRWSWAWTCYLLNGPASVRAELLAYVRELQVAAPAQSLAARLNQTTAEPTSRLAEFLREESRGPSFVMPARYEIESSNP